MLDVYDGEGGEGTARVCLTATKAQHKSLVHTCTSLHSLAFFETRATVPCSSLQQQYTHTPARNARLAQLQALGARFQGLSRTIMP